VLHPGSKIDAVCLYRALIDVRKSIDGLARLVEQELGLNPFGTALYVFINRRRDKIKALYLPAPSPSLTKTALPPSPHVVSVQDHHPWPALQSGPVCLLE